VWVGSFIPHFLYLWERAHCYPLDASWVGPRTGMLAVEKEKTSAPATRIKSQFPCHIAHSLLFILTVLFQLIRSLILLLYGDQKQWARKALYMWIALLNPLPVQFKSLLPGQKGCVFFSGHLNLRTAPETALPSREKNHNN
jgi:hypothetical protein